MTQDCALKIAVDFEDQIFLFSKNKSVFVDKKSREQFQITIHRRIVELLNSTSKTVDSLMKLDMPAGVDVEIKT